MGLEAINFFFRSDEPIEDAIVSNTNFTHCEGGKYVYKKDNDYWIDLEIQDLYSVSVRITLCNPKESVMVGLYNLLSFLFSFKGATLIDMSTKQLYKLFNSSVKEDLEKSYLKRKKVFEELYGNYTAAIGTDEFYKRQRK